MIINKRLRNYLSNSRLVYKRNHSTKHKITVVNSQTKATCHLHKNLPLSSEKKSFGRTSLKNLFYLKRKNYGSSTPRFGFNWQKIFKPVLYLMNLNRLYELAYITYIYYI